MPPPGAGGGSERLTGHGPSASEGRVRAGAKRGGGGAWDVGGAGVEGFDGFLIVFMPPPGAGGGSEQSGRTSRALAKGRERTGASGGVGGEGVVGGASGFVLVILPPPGAGGGGER